MPPSPNSPGNPTPVQDADAWRAALERRLGRRLSIDETAWVKGVIELLELLEWREGLYAKDLAVLDPGLVTAFPKPSEPLGSGLWETPPRSAPDLWNRLAYLLQEKGLPLPPALAEAADTVSVAREIAARRQVRAARLWKNRLANAAQRAGRSPAALWDVRLRLQGKRASWEGRQAPDAPYQPIPAREFADWAAKGFGFLQRFAPESLPLCALFQERFAASQRAQLDLDNPEDAAFLNQALANPLAAGRIVSSEGAPLRRAPAALRWAPPEIDPSDDSQYLLRLQLADGAPAPAPLRHLPGERPLYLCGATLYDGPPLLQPGDDPNQPRALPRPALESSEGLLFLRSQKLPPPPALQSRIFPQPLEPALHASLEGPEASATIPGQPERLSVRLAAVSRDRAHWRRLSADGWLPSFNLDTGEPCPPDDESLALELPEAGPLLDLLERFDLAEEEPGVWQREIGHRFPVEFASWIRSVPDGVQIVVDDELDSLVEAHPVGRYALDVAPAGKPDWFEVSLAPAIEDASLEPGEIQRLLEAGGDFVRLPGKGWRRFETALDPEQAALLEAIGLSPEEAKAGPSAYHALQLADADLQAKAFEKSARAIAQAAQRFQGRPPPPVPKSVATPLRPYQQEGFRFLCHLAQNQFGGILADDMGLGKTLQSLAWLAWLKESQAEDAPFRCLAVCPKSVVQVWKSEAARHVPSLRLALFDPAQPRDAASEAAQADLLVASYAQLRSQRAYFLAHNWTAAILDEAQHIKNPQSQVAKTARALKAARRLCLTGTPVENRALDLWSLFAFAMPGLLGGQTSFARRYRSDDPDAPRRLSRRVKGFLLRRSKRQVAPDLPPRSEETLLCELEGEQRRLYQETLDQARQRLRRIDSERAFQQERFNILASLLRLRQICCHPGLVDPNLAEAPSAKLEALLELVDELREEGHKLLVFSQFTKMLDLVSRALDRRNCHHLSITGKTENRASLVDRFQTDPSVPVFLLSLRAAGSGLNLTAASYVVLFDPWWNPAVEAQAIDRTHRIGQTSPVNAYRLIAQDTVEAKIQSLQLAKEKLASEIVREESLQSVLDLESLRALIGE